MDENILDEMDLPLSNKNEDIETISKNRLRPLFDVVRYEIRSEDLRDKGIDLQIELKKANKYTNFRFAVQLKATDTPKTNQDGSISLQVATSNINYLLNNPMPAYYILYAKTSDTFYFENLNDFAKSLSFKNPDWQKQKTHVIRFTKKLTEDAIAGIYNDTLQKGKFHRHVNEKLIQQSALIKEGDKILVDENLNVTGDTEIRNLIETSGFLLINEGRWKDVILLHKKGSGSIGSTGKYNLILGEAYYYNGNLIDSLSYLKKAEKLQAELPPVLLSHLEYFLISVKYSLGLVSDAEYKKRMSELEDADNIGLYIRIDNAKYEYYHATAEEPEQAHVLLKKLIQSVSEILDHPKADHGLRFFAECELMLIKGSKINWDYVQEVLRINAVESITGQPQKEMRLRVILWFYEANSVWVKKVGDLQRDILAHRNYFYYFNAVINEVKVFYETAVLLSNISFETPLSDVRPPKIADQDVYFTGLLDKVSNALKFYRHIGHIENEIVSLCLEYEIKHYLQKYPESSAILSEVERLIDTYELSDKKRRIKHLKNGGTVHEAFRLLLGRSAAEANEIKMEYDSMIKEMTEMDLEDRKQNRSDTNYMHIHLFPIGFFQFPENSKDKVYDILGIKNLDLKNHFDHLFTFIIPVVNIHYSEITEEGPRDGNMADQGIKNWRNIYRIRKAFFDNMFFRDESIP